ncbi:MAG: PilZ domain-containing protein [Kiloniellaceae bacterium]
MPDSARKAPDRRERRRHKRAHVLFAACLLSGDRLAGALVRDVSAGGAKLQLTEGFDPFSAVTLRMARSVDFHVKIAWRKGNLLGLRFREGHAHIASTLAGLLPAEALAA